MLYYVNVVQQRQAADIFRGRFPNNDGTELSMTVMPDGVPIVIPPGAARSSPPGLDPELLALIQATSEVEIAIRREAQLGFAARTTGGSTRAFDHHRRTSVEARRN